MINILYIYSIGSLTYYYKINRPELAFDWRAELDAFAYEKGFRTFNPALTFEIEVNKKFNNRMCVDQNEFYISQCNLAVVNMNDILQSPGSIYELVTFKQQNKPVIAFGERTWSPHLESCISHWCKDLSKVKDLLSTMFCQNNFNKN